MVERIRAVHAESDCTDGMPRVRAERIDQGVQHRPLAFSAIDAAPQGLRSRRRGFVVMTRRDETHRLQPDEYVPCAGPPVPASRSELSNIRQGGRCARVALV
jgi:hypothetical protein